MDSRCILSIAFVCPILTESKEASRRERDNLRLLALKCLSEPMAPVLSSETCKMGAWISFGHLRTTKKSDGTVIFGGEVG